MSSFAEDTAEVLVVGAGPVGLSTAAFLAHRGIRPLVVEKHPSTSPHHRASTSLRTLELFRGIGLGPELDRLGWISYGALRSVFKDTALGTTRHVADLPPRHRERLRTCSPEAPRLLSQQQLEQLLVPEIRRLGGEIRFHTRLAEFADTGSGIRARVEDVRTGRPAELRAAYLIGADGAHSTVRRALGIEMPDREVAGHLNTAFYRADLGSAVDEWGTHFCFARNENVYATVASFNGGELWSSHIMDYPGKPGGPAELSADKALELLHAAIGKAVPIELMAVNAWTAAIGTAASFRQGRAFLVGDAAHVQSSAGGLGMNTGIQDGHNLAWKLAEVLRGAAAPALLDTYEPERRAAADASLAISRGLHTAYLHEPDRDPNALYERLGVDYLRGMMFYGYESPAVLGADPVAQADVFGNRVQPGRRLPHLPVTGGGPGLSTLDLVGPGWTLLTGDGAWLPAADRAAAALGLELRGHHLANLGPDWPDPAAAVLVRPDGFVAWCSSAGDRPDALTGVLRRLLGS
ncbi:FAD-dependent oxidoreductase [Amycolatopsis anabasis]|uniref:FAD-dependent oxidoreductase n=1 Tax=Amycolatopsis anabasis TaxID=1840409 RepID=UPI00131BF8F6|nr:FAD-dependent oxidoreductase [Amycolatopsis anabasis]